MLYFVQRRSLVIKWHGKKINSLSLVQCLSEHNKYIIWNCTIRVVFLFFSIILYWLACDNSIVTFLTNVSNYYGIPVSYTTPDLLKLRTLARLYAWELQLRGFFFFCRYTTVELDWSALWSKHNELRFTVISLKSIKYS